VRTATARSRTSSGRRAAEAAFYYQTTDRGGLAVADSVRSGAQLWQTELPSLVGWIISGTALTAVEDGQGASGLPSRRWGEVGPVGDVLRRDRIAGLQLQSNVGRSPSVIESQGVV
jgi:hypothetical protein